MLVLSLMAAMIGMVIAANGEIGGRTVSVGGVLVGSLIAACVMGTVMSAGKAAAGFCMILALVTLTVMGVSAGSILFCCIPAAVMAFHFARGTGSA